MFLVFLATKFPLELMLEFPCMESSSMLKLSTFKGLCGIVPFLCEKF